MAKLQFANFGVAPQTAPAPTPDRNDRPKAEAWLNIGITVSMNRAGFAGGSNS